MYCTDDPELYCTDDPELYCTGDAELYCELKLEWTLAMSGACLAIPRVYISDSVDEWYDVYRRVV